MIWSLGLLLVPVMLEVSGTGAAGDDRRFPSLQARIDGAAPGDVLVVEGGIHHGPITVRGPLTLKGKGDPVIDGRGAGSVVTVLGEGVVLEGFTIRNSGREVSEEAAGIKAEGSRHAFENNRIENVYFGIHLSRGSDNLVRGNRIVPGDGHGARPGHGISLWYQQSGTLAENRIAHARDGIYLSFSDDVRVENNTITDSRYGLHSMYAVKAFIRGNHLRGNLLGAALMYSEELTMDCNRIEEHREGATAYGVLLKDIDELRMERNVIQGNRVGIYADNTPQRKDRYASIRGNLLAGNDAALALQSNVALIFSGNSVVNNLTTVRAEGARLSRDNRWSAGGRGNYWDEYRGYDLDANGIGDIPYRYEVVMNELIRRTPLARAFLYTPAHLALESGARLFPIYRPDPLIVDEHPLMRSPGPACMEGKP